MSWQSEMYRKQGELNRFIDKLEDQRQLLLDALKDISVGLAPSSYPDSWSHATKLQNRAATTLEAAAKMRLERP